MITDIAYRLRRRLDRTVRGGRGVVLLYHRIADEVSDPYGLCVSPAHFEQHLQHVREAGQPMSLTEMIRSLRCGAVPDRAICITFDDGYIDNLDHAAPLLQQYDVPATIFVTTGRGGRDREFWWDELERVFMQPGVLPERLDLDLDGQLRSWSLGTAVRYTADDQARCRGWHLNDEDSPTPRHTAFREVYHAIRPLPVAARTAAMDRLLAWAGLQSVDVRHTHAVMEARQVADLARDGLVQIGAHTINHPDLPSQDRATQRVEIDSSKHVLEEWIGAEVSGFAYPYGLYNDESVDAVRASGFDFACAGDHQLVRRRADPLLLPRIDVPIGSGDAVARLLRRWFW
jgi:peptidoglycan/xylan/chitin deacetylase (PgdA/CDA1 family)